MKQIIYQLSDNENNRVVNIVSPIKNKLLTRILQWLLLKMRAEAVITKHNVYFTIPKD